MLNHISSSPVASAAASGGASPAPAPARRQWRHLRVANLWLGAAIVTVVVLCALFAPYLAPHDPHEQDLLHMLTPPMWVAGGDAAFPLGTDNLGRDVFSRLLYGSRVALTVAVIAAFGAGIVGSALAILAGYFGGWVDRLVSYCVDLWMSFPPVVLSLVLMVSLGVGIENVILSIVLVDWTRFCRVVRAEVMVVRQRDYILAAQLLNLSHLRIMVREILPAALPLVITLFSLEMGVAIAVEALLSFVGMSVPADVASWGVMIADARLSMHDSLSGLLLPVLAIIVTVLGCNLLGDGLRVALDPRMRPRGE
ncbi:ABC transporter permease [Herbaspirillum sp. alder98]|uniref:ABC transporter permease n=1 Tax=Herbaspirillum sp. alder98 TaxID=2913096 RepID=UPI001CD84639|nr:ABC transporter permease [Herbaspirillum sp. alder98]MCA1325363.1 ABC transporter permease [Herbaspirillum sp. alder98]